MEKKRILIVDDDEHMRSAIKRLLGADLQYELAEIENGSKAEEIARQFKPDLIILDINMPGKDGYEVCCNIRNGLDSGQVKIIAISGLGGHIGGNIMSGLGADAFFEKPFEGEQFQKKVAELLNRSRL